MSEYFNYPLTSHTQDLITKEDSEHIGKMRVLDKLNRLKTKEERQAFLNEFLK